MIKKTTNWFRNHLIEMTVSILLMSLIFFSALPSMLVSIDSGNQGVLWRRFFGGTELDYAYPEGTTLIFPWDKMTIYNIRLQRMNATYNTLASNGLEIIVTTSFRFRPYQVNLPELHKFVGENYVDVLLLPEMGAHVRKVISTYKPEELYSIRRDVIQDQILESVRREITTTPHDKDIGDEDRHLRSRDYIHVDDVLIRGIELPEQVRAAIETKEKAKQTALTYEHRLASEREEKIRKKIEAEGIRDFQETVAGGISDKYLKWKAIGATLELARSHNSKVVIIGSGENGLPVILGKEFTGGPSNARADVEIPNIEKVGLKADPLRDSDLLAGPPDTEIEDQSEQANSAFTIDQKEDQKKYGNRSEEQKKAEKPVASNSSSYD